MTSASHCAPAPPRPGTGRLLCAIVLALAVQSACNRPPAGQATASPPEEPSPRFRNIATPTSYAGDSACSACHRPEATVYGRHSMAHSFHRWTPGTRIEAPLDTAIHHAPTGFSYGVVEERDHLYQVEFLTGPDGSRLHELRKRMDYVMGSGHVARTYFTEDNGRLFQLPLTWYSGHGWDFSPGYEVNNARFERSMPDHCVGCHSSYPTRAPYLEGKYVELRDGIGCERCHGPGELHVRERRASVRGDSGYDNSIVNPARLPLERRLDVCEQCHVHTAVSVLREGKDAFSYLPSQPLHDTWAFYRVSGSIDLVSQADRLRHSACFIATRTSARPLECATCHDPHRPPAEPQDRSRPCQGCHSSGALEQRLARSASLADHTPNADCVGCHMPRVQARRVHGAFTEHWIRVVSRDSARTAARAPNAGRIEPYYERDRIGPEARLYQGMGEVVFGTLANSSRAMGEAAAALRTALGKDTTHSQARFLLGVAYQQLGQTDDAIRALEASVRSDSSRPESLRALAQAYERAGRPAAAIEPLYRRALDLQPALAWIRAEYGDFLQAEGRRDDAERAYRLALTEQPGLAVTWFNLGTVLAAQGRLREAADAFQEAVHLNPSYAQALSPLFEIRTIGNAVSGVSGWESPAVRLPVRERGPGAFAVTVAGAAGLEFLNVPTHGFVLILKPDGTLVRALATADATALRWDLMVDTRKPIAGGLYRAQVQGRDASGQPVPAQPVYFGVVRRRGD